MAVYRGHNATDDLHLRRDERRVFVEYGRPFVAATNAGPHGLQFTELYSYHAAGALTGKRLGVSGTALGTNTANLDGGYTYDSLGNLTAVQYPFAQWANGAVVTAGPQYSYTYDAMNRASGMTGPNSQTLVSSVSYNPANQILQLNRRRSPKRASTTKSADDGAGFGSERAPEIQLLRDAKQRTHCFHAGCDQRRDGDLYV